MNGLGSTFIIVSILSRSIFKVRTWLTDFRSILMIFRMWKIIHLTKSCHYGRPRWLKIGQDGRKLPSWTRPSELFFKVTSMIKYQVLQVPKILQWLCWRFARSRLDFMPGPTGSNDESHCMSHDGSFVVRLPRNHMSPNGLFSYCIIQELEYVQ